jgi:hypothetical protein
VSARKRACALALAVLLVLAGAAACGTEQHRTSNCSTTDEDRD